MSELTKTYPRFRLQKYNFFLKWQAFGVKNVFYSAPPLMTCISRCGNGMLIPLSFKAL